MVTSPFVVVFWRGSSEKIGGDIVCVVCVCGALGGRSSVLSPCKIALLICVFLLLEIYWSSSTVYEM